MDNFGKIYILMQRVRNNGYEYCNYDYSSGTLDFVETKTKGKDEHHIFFAGWHELERAFAEDEQKV